MTESVIKQAEEQGLRLAVIPSECLNDIKGDIAKVINENELNGYQKWITTEQYVLDIPAAVFEVRSIIVAVFPYKLVRVEFNHNGKCARDIIESQKIDAKEVIKALAEKYGFHADVVEWMPEKRLAVRSGLCEYGRNNITYSKELGSFQGIVVFMSDLEPEKYTWREVKNADICEHCGLCIKKCPTGAISKERFMIDIEHCITKVNEWGTHEMPEWIPKKAHNHLTGCLRCQENCPMNKKRIADIKDKVEFNEIETEYLLSDKSMTVPEGLMEKLAECHIDPNYESLARNLRLMLDSVE
jgi:epoxyqueuosine reductase